MRLVIFKNKNFTIFFNETLNNYNEEDLFNFILFIQEIFIENKYYIDFGDYRKIKISDFTKKYKKYKYIITKKHNLKLSHVSPFTLKFNNTDCMNSVSLNNSIKNITRNLTSFSQFLNLN
jgi:hypothetical protein